MNLEKMDQNYDTRAMISILEKQQRDFNTRIATVEYDKALAIAKKLKENNISIDIISSSTGLSKEEIELNFKKKGVI